MFIQAYSHGNIIFGQIENVTIFLFNRLNVEKCEFINHFPLMFVFFKRNTFIEGIL